MENLYINNLSIFDDCLSKLKKGMLLLNLYTTLAGQNNQLRLTKDEIVKALDISRRTANSWVKLLVDCNAIKYKTNGTTFLNPYYFYKGNSAEYQSIILAWNKFKSDLKTSA